MNNTITVAEAADASAKIGAKSVDDILTWALDRFGNGLGFMTALGYSGVVLMDHLRRLVPAVEAYFIDTGFHFAETLEFLGRLRDEWSVDFRIITPSMSWEELTARLGPEPWKANPDLCCLYMKVESLLRVIHDKDAWVSAIRRDQSPSRDGIDVVEIDGRGVPKVYPMAAWTYDRTWQYIRRNNLPYNPLHDQGYPNVGCIHCTSPVAPGEHERSGRWQSMPKLECGIHVRREDKAVTPEPASADSKPARRDCK